MRILFVILCLTGVSAYAADRSQSTDSTKTTFSEESGEYAPERALVHCTSNQNQERINAFTAELTCRLKREIARREEIKEYWEQETGYLDELMKTTRGVPARTTFVKESFEAAMLCTNVGKGALLLANTTDISPSELFENVFDDEWEIYCCRRSKKARQQTDLSSLA